MYNDLSVKTRSISVEFCGFVVNELECNKMVSKFELQSYYYFHFWTNTYGKGIKPHLPFHRPVLLPKFKYPVYPTALLIAGGRRWVHVFLKDIPGK